MTATTQAAADARRRLAARLLERRMERTWEGAIPRRQGDGPVPLTPAQAGIWFFTQLFPGSAEYNVFDTLRVPWSVGREQLGDAVATLVERHDALRLRVVVVDGEPYQLDGPAFRPDVEWFDLRDRPPTEAVQRADEIANDCARDPIPVDRPPLFRVAAVALPSDELLVVLVVHHLVTDYASTTLLLGELSALLAGRSPGPPPAAGFLDYAAWVAAGRDEAAEAADLDYWTERLGGDLPVLDLPEDRPRPDAPTRRGHSVAVTLDPAVVAALAGLARDLGTTLFVVLLAAYDVLLYRLTSQRDVVVGTALTGRDHPGCEEIVGCFVRSVALRIRLDGRASFRDVVAAAHDSSVEAHDHQRVPFERVVEALGVPRRLDVHPVFQTFFGFQAGDVELSGAEVNPVTLVDYGSAKWDLSLSLNETPRGVEGTMEGSADLFDAATVARYRDVFVHLCSRLAAEPDAPIADHPLVDDAERDRILYGLNDYRPCRVECPTVASPFEEQVRRTPGAVAVEAGGRSLTYAELDARANRLAWTMRALGARRGERVALCLDRSLEMLVAVHAVAKTGAAYVPLDPALPHGRLAFMVADTEPAFVVADAAGAARVGAVDRPVLAIDDLDARSAGRPATTPPQEGDGSNLSHLLYTSGSTGRPKAVACAVATAVGDIVCMQERWPYRPGDVTLFKTSYGFDTSLWELAWPLYHGATVVIAPPGAERDPAALADLVEHHGVTTVYLVPTLLQAFLAHARPGRFPRLRCVLTGGEPVTPRLRDEFLARLPGVELVNGYGPTETGCMVNHPLVAEDDHPATVPLGRPHRNYRLYVLDDAMHVLPVGVPGEAYASAEHGMSHGYHGRPDLTAERFLPDPYGPPGTRMYRTGDVCRYRPDGVIEFLGRVDRQVKVRGVRIEPAEIEAVLADHPAVAEAVVLTVGEAGDETLVAVVRPAAEVLDVAAVLAHAAASLPPHMVPVAVKAVDGIPVNVNGKTDRRALREGWDWDAAARPAGAVEPAPGTEQALARIFARVLGLPTVGATESFFALGGHSLLTFKLVAACAAELGVEPRVADVFTNPSVRMLAGVVDGLARATHVVPLAPADRQPRLVLVVTADEPLPVLRRAAESLRGELSCLAVVLGEGDAAVDRCRELLGELVGDVPVVLAAVPATSGLAHGLLDEWRDRDADVAGVVPVVVPQNLGEAGDAAADADAAALARELLEAACDHLGFVEI